MSFTFALSSIGFIGRFIIAFIILAYLYSNNKNDEHLRKGFKILCIAGVTVFALFVVMLILFLVFGSIGLLSGLGNNLYYSFSHNFPF